MPARILQDKDMASICAKYVTATKAFTAEPFKALKSAPDPVHDALSACQNDSIAYAFGCHFQSLLKFLGYDRDLPAIWMCRAPTTRQSALSLSA